MKKAIAAERLFHKERNESVRQDAIKFRDAAKGYQELIDVLKKDMRAAGYTPMYCGEPFVAAGGTIQTKKVNDSTEAASFVPTDDGIVGTPDGVEGTADAVCETANRVNFSCEVPRLPVDQFNVWNCTHCHASNTTKSRCGNCKKWRGGQRKTPYKRKQSKSSKAKPAKRAKKGNKKAKKGTKKIPIWDQSSSSGNSDDDSNSNKGDVPLRAARVRGATEGVTAGIPPAVGGTPETGRDTMMSPITTMDMSSVANQTIDSTAVIETNEWIRMEGMRADFEEGDGGDSDEEGEGCYEMEDLEQGLLESSRDRAEGDAFETEMNMNCHQDDWHKSEGGGANVTPWKVIPGAPFGWIPPLPPLDYEPPMGFDNVDNPGGWHSYNYRPVYKQKKGQKKEYQGYYAMPAGATVVSRDKNHDGRRMYGGWEFFYDGWKLDDSVPKTDRNYDSYHHNVEREKMFPPERDASLDADLLIKMGLTRERMIRGDALFFYQLVLPICDPDMSGIPNDPRKGFYVPVSDMTNKYAIVEKHRGGNYGHYFHPTTAEELLQFDGIVAMNRNTNIHDSWCTDNERRYDSLIAATMKHRRFIDLRGLIKLNDNTVQKKRGERGYDPCAKYNMIWDVICHNMNAILNEGGDDICIDETSWSHMGFGSEALERVYGKPGINKGGQTVIAVSAKRRYLLAYHHRHRLQPRLPPFTQQGPSEIASLIESLFPLVEGNPKRKEDERRIIFKNKPCLLFDNHFSGDDVMDYIGSLGWKACCTNRRDRLPKGCLKLHFHHLKNTKMTCRSKGARFEKPIVAVKCVSGPDSSYVRAHISFQSTGSTNISTVNCLDQCDLYVRTKERGRKEFKRQYGIEMNDARDLYLGGYCAVDGIDHLLKNWDIKYCTWKWYHSPMRHAKAFASVMAYQMYRECAEGNLNTEWKLNKPMTAKDFRENLAEQMCEYRPYHLKYPGDANFRATTNRNMRKRGTKSDQPAIGKVTLDDFIDTKFPKLRSDPQRFCNDDLSDLREHINKMKFVGHQPRTCVVCGKQRCHWYCTICNKYMCFRTGPKQTDISCVVDYHNECMFGLCKDDIGVVGKRLMDWKYPSNTQKTANRHHIESLREHVNTADKAN
jgi:hypothetical protein